MLQAILSYIAQNAPALCWGFGFGLMVGTFLVALGAARQYEKGREDGFEAGRTNGYDTGFEDGMFHSDDYDSPLIRGEGRG